MRSIILAAALAAGALVGGVEPALANQVPTRGRDHFDRRDHRYDSRRPPFYRYGYHPYYPTYGHYAPYCPYGYYESYYYGPYSGPYYSGPGFGYYGRDFSFWYGF